MDFAGDAAGQAAERSFYDQAYLERTRAVRKVPLDLKALDQRWHDSHWPECPVILRLLGNLKEKTVVCVGNGASMKEMYFLTLGARVIHSDLSFSGVLDAKAQQDLGRWSQWAAFHAINAYQLPLADESVDVVYGFEFAHHLSDLPSFLREAWRVLRKGGTGIFFDHAYSPLWYRAKMTALRPLMRMKHALHGISPEDIRATYAPGFTEAGLTATMQACGELKPFFERTTFFQYLAITALATFIGWRRPTWIYKTVGMFGRILDKVLTDTFPFMARNRIEMVWGFRKAG